jgi:hypothetical protein
MTGINIVELVVSIVVFWSLALAPPLLTRFLILKRPMGKLGTWVFVIVGWFINWSAQHFTGVFRQELTGGKDPDPGDIGILAMAWATYAILRYGAKKKSATELS